jgi:hypothetical protein
MNFNKFIGVPRKPPLLEVLGQAEQAPNLQGPMKNGRWLLVSDGSQITDNK